VQCVGRDAEHDPTAVLLARLLQVPQEACYAAEPDEQDAGRVRVERARMAHALLPVDAAQLRDDVVTGPARLLVDDNQPVTHRRAACAQCGGVRAELAPGGSSPRDPSRDPVPAPAWAPRDLADVDLAE